MPNRVLIGCLLLMVVLGPAVLLGVGWWGSYGPVPWMVELGVFGVVAALGLAWLLLRRPAAASGAVSVSADPDAQRLIETARAQLRAADLRMREVMDALPAGVAIYDSQDRLLLHNDELARQYPYRGSGKVIGETYEALMRHALERGEIPEALGREEEWLGSRMSGRGSLSTPMLRHTDDGQWVHLYEIRTPSGYLVMTRLDMTPMVEKGLALEKANEQLLRLSTTDGLTGIANRRMFDQTLRAEWQRCARNQGDLSLLMIDIDHFKAYNDHYGHQTGDECLRQVARILSMCAKRSGELVARYGGEEFVILLPSTDAQEAMAVAQRCLQEMRNARIAHAESPLSPWLSVSVGVATMKASNTDTPAALTAQADSAMYCAKKSGRDRFEMFDPERVNALASRPAPL